jgi:hypothetical protein
MKNRISKNSIWLLIMGLIIGGCAAMRWQEATSKNTIAGYEEFLRREPNSSQAREAKEKIESLYFQRANKTNTLAAYIEFLKRYPNSQYSSEAKTRIENLYWQNAMSQNTIPAYEDFIQKYPHSRFVVEAKSRVEFLRFTVYILARDCFLNAEPKFGTAISGANLELGQPLDFIERRDPWMRVKIAGQEKTGWIHNGCMTPDMDILDRIVKSKMVPSGIMAIEEVSNRSTADGIIVSGKVTMDSNTRKAIPKEGNCIVFTGQAADKIRQIGGFDFKAFGSNETVTAPVPNTLYYYSEKDRRYAPIADRLQTQGN